MSFQDISINTIYTCPLYSVLCTLFSVRNIEEFNQGVDSSVEVGFALLEIPLRVQGPSAISISTVQICTTDGSPGPHDAMNSLASDRVRLELLFVIECIDRNWGIDFVKIPELITT
jgi:hypothetical protein